MRDGMRGGIFMAIYRYAEVNLYEWAMSQKLPVNSFELIEENS